MTADRELFIAGNVDDLAREAAGRVVESAHRAIQARGRFAIALSGGSTPRRLYLLLAEPPYRQAVDWSSVHIFFADERFVPHAHPESTVLLVRETLLQVIPLPAENFHAVPTESGTPEQCAARYGEELAAFFAGAVPALDLVLLGMGPDGHTASLFSGHPEATGLVAAVHDSPKPPPIRLTLTLETLRAAREVMFLVTGADKAETLARVFESGIDDPGALPAARVSGSDGRSSWLVDPDAARLLQE